jgi:predicted esterase
MRAQILDGVLAFRWASSAQDATAVPEPYRARQVFDRIGRKIDYYITVNPTPKALPLVVFIQGSGANSHFRKSDAGISDTFGFLRSRLEGKALLLLVEKPGIRFLDQYKPYGGATNAPSEFRREHTLDRWSEAILASLKDAMNLPGVDRSRLLVAGHSEGALVACRVAAKMPVVTHVAPLSSGGVTQLFSLMELARAESEQKVNEILAGWQAVAQDPENFNKFWMGHPYLRWSSFFASSCMQELPSNPGAMVYMAHGTQDRSSAIQSSDALYAFLLASRRSVTYERIEGGDHSLGLKSQPKLNGLAEVFGRITTWFLE